MYKPMSKLDAKACAAHNAAMVGHRAGHASPAIPKSTHQAPLGSGGRFKALTAKLSGKKGVYNAAGLAAFIGRKKYGASKMAKMSAAGRRRHK